jgi:hypothetical protein
MSTKTNDEPDMPSLDIVDIQIESDDLEPSILPPEYTIKDVTATNDDSDDNDESTDMSTEPVT